MKTRILVVDDHPLMRKGLALTLSAEPDLDVVAQAADAEEALRLFDAHDPDLVLVDVSLPGMNGLELVKHLVARDPDVRTLVVSHHDEALYAERAVQAGAKGYASKSQAGDVLVRAVRLVLRGGVYLSEALKDRLLFSATRGPESPMDSPLQVLSDRELEVFEMTGRGLAAREISERLHLSVKTVETYRARIKQKLDLDSGARLMQQAIHWVEDEIN